ncbi:hypothetical protein JIR001_21620 [Polycladomyces abyssicola]|uniref:Uncharacterized protein n=1 Tax=Polycladomyces abyssicola TaxID=1125966 RepID=A0A8D5ZLD0_9BACL|nr:hypothetical protein [Polycladomyces abyssicola]BCU82379.1 hypothetical protein JIR001_21620 [Polycladomyces abyssicola]
MPFVLKINTVSTTGQLNVAPVNFLVNQESFSKTNEANSNAGDLTVSVVFGPLLDSDVVDTPIFQVKGV